MKTETSFKNYFRIISTAYEIIGINYYRSSWPYYNKLDTLYSHIGIILGLCAPLFTIAYLRSALDDLDDLLTCLISFFTAIQGVIKLLTALFAHNTIIELRDIIVKNTSIENIPEEFHAIAKKYNKLAGRVIKLTIVVYCCAWTYFNAYPLFSSKEWILPVAYEIPGISHRGHPGYEINYTYVFYQTVYALMFLFGFDGHIYVTSIYIAYRMELCKQYFKQIGDFTTKYNTAEKQSELLMKCAKVHIETFIFTQKCSKIYSPALLTQLLTTVGLLCMTMVHIRVNIYSSSYMMFQAALVQVFFYCCCGELIVSQASGITTSITESKWYNIRSVSERKMILLMLTGSQIPIGFSAAGFYKLSMETFTEICKKAFSFFTFMMNVM